MKKIINQPQDIIDEMLDGLVLANNELVKRVKNKNVIIRNKNINVNNVSLISGGGSGHEPAHVGYVGYGMLSAAVVGELFTSPTPDQIYTAIKNVPHKNGVLLLIKNYTGDVLNFTLAEEMAKGENILVDHLIIADDIALLELESDVEKRGIAGTILVHKILGAMAENGTNLKELKNFGELIIKNLGTFSIGLTGATLLSSATKSFNLSDDMVEIGLGIHGEPGIRQEIIKTADQYAVMIIEKLIKYLNLQKGDQVGFLLNGLGGSSLIELNIVARKALTLLNQCGIKIKKTFIGNYLTSIDMEGLSISLVKLVDERMEIFLKAKSNTIALKNFENE